MRCLVLQCVWGLPESENHERNYLGDDDEIKYEEHHDNNGDDDLDDDDDDEDNF